MSNLPALRANAAVGDTKTCLQLFQSFEKQIAQIVPQHLRPDVLMNAFVNSCRKTPRLLQCQQGSMISALLHCGVVGWVPDTPAQECHLIPFGNEVVVVGGYRGFIKLVRNSGEICNVVSRVVYAGDKFEYELGSNPRIVHIPKLTDDDQTDGNITHFYSQIWWKDETVYPRDDFEVMSKAQVDKIMAGVIKKNRGKTPGPWLDHYGEQGRKTVQKRHMKRLPMSPEMAHASELDNLAVTVDPQPLHQIVQDMIEAETKGAGDRLADDIGAAENDDARVWSLDDLKTLFGQRGTGLSSVMKSECEADIESGELTQTGITEWCEELNKLDPEPA